MKNNRKENNYSSFKSNSSNQILKEMNEEEINNLIQLN